MVQFTKDLNAKYWNNVSRELFGDGGEFAGFGLESESEGDGRVAGLIDSLSFEKRQRYESLLEFARRLTLGNEFKDCIIGI